MPVNTPDFKNSFATRQSAFRPSPVRSVFETAMRPEVISLAGGNPDLSFLPHQFLAEITAQLLRDNGEEILQYGSGAGTDKCRELSCMLTNWSGANYGIDEIQITSGSQAGLDAVTKLFCDPGDVILAEAPTYVGVLSTFEAYQVQLRQIPIDHYGLAPEVVEAAIKQAKSEGHRVKFLYTIPAFQNPSGICLSPRRAEQLLEVCARHQVIVIEDDAYGLLGFDDSTQVKTNAPLCPTNTFSAASRTKTSLLPSGLRPRARSLAAIAPELVIHLGSYSKIFSPGARVGWIAAPKQVRARLQIGCESVCITPSVLSQALVENYVGSPQWATALEQQIAAYQQRAAATLEAVSQLLPQGSSWNVPQGGFFLWIKLPDDWAAHIKAHQIDLLNLAIAHQVVIVPGGACYLKEEPGCHLRIAFSAIEADQIKTGIYRLAQALNTLSLP